MYINIRIVISTYFIFKVTNVQEYNLRPGDNFDNSHGVMWAYQYLT